MLYHQPPIHNLQEARQIPPLQDVRDLQKQKDLWQGRYAWTMQLPFDVPTLQPLSRIWTRIEKFPQIKPCSSKNIEKLEIDRRYGGLEWVCWLELKITDWFWVRVYENTSEEKGEREERTRRSIDVMGTWK